MVFAHFIKKSTLLKITFAMAVISLYTYVFGIMDIVDSVQVTRNEPIINDEDAHDIAEPPSSYQLNVANGRMPHPADYDAPVISRANVNNETDLSTAAPAVTTTPAVTTIANISTNGGQSQATDAPSVTNPQPSSDNSPSDGTIFRVSANGSTVEGDAFDIVSRVVQGEIGSSFHKEAIKAQAVAVYTYIKRQNASGVTPSLPMTATASDRVKDCVKEVWGKAIYYNGELIQAVFCASTAGWSSSAKNVWGDDIPYLRSVRCAFDEQHDPNQKTTVTFTSSEIMTNVLRQTGIQLSDNPANWIKILGQVDTVYVGEMSIGGKTTYTSAGKEEVITGRVFREKIMGFALRSASFSFTYDKNSDTFTFTTTGYGHGAGMSQNGANILATHQGYSYIDILQHYYMGVTVS